MISFPSTPISFETLQGQSYLPAASFGAFAKATSLPVLITELASLIGQYVLAFEKQDQVFVPVVLTDAGFNRNLYVGNDGSWMCRHVPLCLRNYPFCFAPNDEGERVLSIASNRLVPAGQDGALPLFKEDGSLSDAALRHSSSIQKLEEAFRKNLQRIKVLEDEGLIADWPLKVRLEKDKEPISVDGLYRIDPEKLLALTGDRLEHLKNHGVLTFALSQPMSMQHINVLMERAAYLIKQDTRSKVTSSLAVEPSRSSFDLSDDEMISF